MAKKSITKKQKNNIFLIVILLLVAFALAIILVPGIELKADSSKFAVDTVNWFTEVKANLQENSTMIIMFIVVIFSGAFFLKHKVFK